MDESLMHRIDGLLADEHGAASEALKHGEVGKAWQHLERAHILAQRRLVPHCNVHWRMLQLSAQQRDWREIIGQMFRLALAPIGNLTGRLPLGNTGRANVSAFAPMVIPPDLEAILRSIDN